MLVTLKLILKIFEELSSGRRGKLVFSLGRKQLLRVDSKQWIPFTREVLSAKQ